MNEAILREWEASTFEDLPPPSLPFYIPGTPNIQIHPISWVPSDMPLPVDNGYTGSEEDYDQSPTHTPASSSRLKGKQPEHGNSEVMDNSPTYERKRFCQTPSPTRTVGKFSDLGHLILDPEQERHLAGTSLAPWDRFELGTNTADQPRPPNQLSSSLPLSYDIECSSSSWAPVSLTPSHDPIPDFASYTPRFSYPMDKPMARYESPENFDCASDSSSETSDSTTHASFAWIDSESSPSEGFITFQNDLPPFPTIDNSDVPLLFDSPSAANGLVIGGSLSGPWRPTLETREPVPSDYKRKRLFVEEDEHGARARKQPRIEQ